MLNWEHENNFYNLMVSGQKSQALDFTVAQK